VKEKLLKVSKELLEQTKADKLESIEVTSEEKIMTGKEVIIRLRYVSMLPGEEGILNKSTTHKIDGME